MDGTFQVAELRAARGFGWLGAAFRIYRQQPLAWIGLCTGWVIITFMLLLLPPPIGVAVDGLLQPVFLAGFVVAAFRQVAGERVSMGDLFSGFRRNVRYLVQFGAIQMLVELAVAAPFMYFVFPPVPITDGAVDLVAYSEALRERGFLIALCITLLAAVKGAFLFGPALIAFHDMTAPQALRWSVYAAISNLAPLVVYGLCVFALMIVSALTWGLGFLVVIPMMMISLFTAYREVFEAARP